MNGLSSKGAWSENLEKESSGLNWQDLFTLFHQKNI